MVERPQNPFRGLSSFKQGTTLFGRDRDLLLFQDRVHSSRTTLLFAGSGVGKSSFLDAKVLPDLEQRGHWTCHYKAWGTEAPFVRLREQVDGRLAQLGRPGIERLDTLLAGKLDAAERERLTGLKAKLTTNSSGSLSEAVRNRFAPFNLGLTESSSARKDPAVIASLPGRFILILDQFEEVFQYHAYRPDFRAFLDELCAVVNDLELDACVVLALREEYLGELSVFDNRVPDVFANHYRLRCPSLAEATQIVRSTCAESNVKPDAEGLVALLDELAKVEVGAGSSAERRNKPQNAAPNVLERDFVAPPYLQLVCKTLWDETPFDTTSKEAEFSFLAGYHPGVAARVLSEYCRQKLEPLGLFQKRLAARAFDFLVTQNGAKIAYQLRQLASLMGTSEKRLSRTLGILSRPDTLILRQSPAPDGEEWIELYHDMYGRIVHRWKTYFNSNYEWTRAVVVLLMILASVFVIQSREQARAQRTESAKDQAVLEHADLDGSAGFIAAEDAFTRLQRHEPDTATGLWGSAWARRAQAAEHSGDTSSALLYWLTALSVVSHVHVGEAPNSFLEKDYRRAAQRIIASSYGSLVATFRVPELEGVLPAGTGSAGESYFVTWSERDVQIWSTAQPQPLRTVTIAEPGPPTHTQSPRTPPLTTPGLIQSGKLFLTDAYLDPVRGLAVVARIDTYGGYYGWLERPVVDLGGAASGNRRSTDADDHLFAFVDGAGESLSLSRSPDGDFLMTSIAAPRDGEYSMLLRHRSISQPSKDVLSWSALGTLSGAAAPYIAQSGRQVALGLPGKSDLELFACDGNGPPSKGSGQPTCIRQRPIWGLPPNVIRRLAVAPDGTWLAADIGDEVRVVSTGELGSSSNIPITLMGSVHQTLRVAGVGNRITVGTTDGLFVWTSPEKEVRRLFVTGILSDDGTTLLSTDRGSGVRAWDVRQMPTPTNLIPGGRDYLLSANGGVWFEMENGGSTVIIKDAANAQTLGDIPINGSADPPRLVAVDAAGKRIACVATKDGRRALSVWDTSQSREPIFRLPSADPFPSDAVVTLDPTGQLLATSDALKTEVVRLSDGHSLLSVLDSSTALDFSPDGQHLLIRSDKGYVTTWDIRTNKLAGRSHIELGKFGRMFQSTAVVGNRNYLLYPPGEGHLDLGSFNENTIQALQLPTSAIAARIALNRDGTIAAALCEDNRLFVWQLESDRPPRQLQLERGYSGLVSSGLSFGGDDRTLFVTIGSHVHRVVGTSDHQIARPVNRAIDEDEEAPPLRVDTTRFLSGDVRTVRPVGRAAAELRVLIDLNGAMALETVSFDDKLDDPELAGGPSELLGTWQRRLGMKVDARGIIVPTTN